MKMIINVFQAVIIGLWVGFTAVSGLVLLLFTFNPVWVNKVCGYYIWSPVVIAIAGIKIISHGLEYADRKRTCIYVSNHESLMDIAIVLRTIPVSLFFVAKKELKKVPLMGWYMTAMGMIFVDRGDRKTAMESIKRAATKIARNRNIISFPEGTRTRSGEIMLFKRGTFILAKSARVPIVPVAITGARKVLPRDSWRLNPGVVHISLGEPVLPEVYENLEVDELALMLRQKVALLKKENQH